ncbi:MAG: CDP-alcohol phosphatidyltransferase family protein [Gemmatimonadaceae bacterium]|nr:CDP-alcohol phosphatidyltransferase family protein [Gemmatimonadaceae bacterium]
MTRQSTDQQPRVGKYAFSDGSLARPILTRWWFTTLFRLTPRWLAANTITLVSTGVLLSVAALAISPPASPGVHALVVLAALQLYVAGDHIDGMQAKATGTAGPLGDWLDHYCDYWAGAILILGYWSLVSRHDERVLFGLCAVLGFGFAITFAEREARQALRFTALGTLEAIVLLSAVLLSWAFAPTRALWQREAIAGFAFATIPTAMGAGMGLMAIIEIARRLGGIPPRVALVAAEFTGLAWLLPQLTHISVFERWLLMPLIGAEYVARVMRGHLVRGAHTRPDPTGVFGVAFLIALWGWPATQGAVPPAMRLLGAYLFMRLMLILPGVLRSLRVPNAS